MTDHDRLELDQLEWHLEQELMSLRPFYLTHPEPLDRKALNEQCRVRYSIDRARRRLQRFREREDKGDNHTLYYVPTENGEELSAKGERQRDRMVATWHALVSLEDAIHCLREARDL